jgi:hypothetical protein
MFPAITIDGIVEIVRQIGRQQGENAYYRACYSLLKHLQELVKQALDEILRCQQIQTPDQPGQSSGDINGTLHDLQESTFDLVNQAYDT